MFNSECGALVDSKQINEYCCKFMLVRMSSRPNVIVVVIGKR